jgi:hypothetical protein
MAIGILLPSCKIKFYMHTRNAMDVYNRILTKSNTQMRNSVILNKQLHCITSNSVILNKQLHCITSNSVILNKQLHCITSNSFILNKQLHYITSNSVILNKQLHCITSSRQKQQKENVYF